MERFDRNYQYKFIYVFSIPYESHRGMLKVGESTVSTDINPDDLPPGCRELNQAAKARIDSYTATASISYRLEYTELAMIQIDGTHTLSFGDKKVHEVLMNSGVSKGQPNGETGTEWFVTDLDTVKAAIKAVKDGRTSIASSEHVSEHPYQAIEFRDEQKAAIVKTLKRFKKSKEMLWNAKMRFGKTLTALEFIRQSQYRRVIIITHRPVVDDGWSTDFKKIFFHGNSKHDYSYERKTKDPAYVFDEKKDKDNDLKIKRLDKKGDYFIYFASIQDLRGSKKVGGKYNKNNAVFSLDWDLILIDEAHEGTQTELGDNVVKALRKKNTRVLALSGTSFNILNNYDDDNVYTWDYIMEQTAKLEWDKKHHGDHNPYADLPKMHIYTYDLGEKLRKYATDEYETKAFNFREFFRTWNRDPGSNVELPANAEEGKFVHESDVQAFLDMMTQEDSKTGYPYSTKGYRDMFRHTLWIVPGVKEAKALSEQLQRHPVFRHFGIANVAGQGDNYEQTNANDALKLVQDTIRTKKYSITLSCGKLTTGVTVPEWSAVLMLAGSYSTAASQYMQTIFRVQSAGVIEGKQKTDCFVFDFAPDRTLKVVTEAINLSRKPGKNQTRNRQLMTEFLNFCPVIAISGSRTKKYSVESMMEQIKQIYAERAVNSGFEDNSIYNDELLKLDELDAEKFNNLKKIIGKSKASAKAKEVKVNGQGLTDEELETISTEEPSESVPKLTAEEIEVRKKLQQAQEARKNAISILRGISIRMPLLIYGADVDVDEDVDIERFVNLVDKDSWEEFMPAGVTKKMFNQFAKYYDRDVFIAAGKRIRRLAAAAEKYTPTGRVRKVAEIFSHFKNPDKETVLTPWRVVNMHMAETIGGWCFYDEAFREDITGEKHRLERPRFVNLGTVTQTVFAENARILEINSKTGLYPLYVAYSFYRQKLGDRNEDDMPLEACWALWDEVLRDNVYVICKTPMAKTITKRTLCGYKETIYNAHYFKDLVNMLKSKPKQFKKKILKGSYWGKDVKNMKFDAVVGNPPYQEETGGAGRQAKPIYNLFVQQAKELQPGYVSMIMPSRWFAGGMNLDEFRDNMVGDEKIEKLVDFTNAKDCFPQISIGGGVCYLLWNNSYKGDCKITNIRGNEVSTDIRSLKEFHVLVRYNHAVPILRKVHSDNFESIAKIISPLMPFGLSTDYRGRLEKSEKDNITLYASNAVTYINEEEIMKGQEYINKYQVMMSKMSAEHAGEPGRDGTFRVFTSTMRVLCPKEACTHSYFLVGNTDSKDEAINIQKYLQSKFVRFLVLLSLSAVNLSKLVFSFVPMQDFSKVWNDKELYKKYGLDEKEISFINSIIKEF